MPVSWPAKANRRDELSRARGQALNRLHRLASYL
jgi:hypothetical protein